MFVEVLGKITALVTALAAAYRPFADARMHCSLVDGDWPVEGLIVAVLAGREPTYFGEGFLLWDTTGKKRIKNKEIQITLMDGATFILYNKKTI